MLSERGSLVVVPVSFFLTWLWSCVIFVFHFVHLAAVNFVAWLMMAVHFVTAVEVLADTKVHHMSEGQVKLSHSVVRAAVFIGSVVDTADSEVKRQAATNIDTQSRISANEYTI